MGKIIKEFFRTILHGHANAFWMGCIGSSPVYLAFVSTLHIGWATVIVILMKACTAVTLSFITGIGAALSADFYRHTCKKRVDRLFKPKIKRNEKDDNERAA